MPFLPAISGWYREPTGPNARLHICKTGCNLDRRRLTFVLSRELIEQAGWQARGENACGNDNHLCDEVA